MNGLDDHPESYLVVAVPRELMISTEGPDTFLAGPPALFGVLADTVDELLGRPDRMVTATEYLQALELERARLTAVLAAIGNQHSVPAVDGADPAPLQSTWSHDQWVAHITDAGTTVPKVMRQWHALTAAAGLPRPAGLRSAHGQPVLAGLLVKAIDELRTRRPR